MHECRGMVHVKTHHTPNARSGSAGPGWRGRDERRITGGSRHRGINHGPDGTSPEFDNFQAGKSGKPKGEIPAKVVAIPLLQLLCALSAGTSDRGSTHIAGPL